MSRKVRSLEDTPSMRDLIKDLEEAKLRKKERPPNDILYRLRRNIKNTKEQLEVLEKTLKEAEAVPFKIGDAVFHAEYGNCLIREMDIGEGISQNIPEHLHGKVIVELITINGYKTVGASELCPIGPATKVLFDEGNKT